MMMPASNNDTSHLIVVALRALDRMDPLLIFAESIARNSHADLTLIHVVDSMAEAIERMQVGVPYGPWPMFPRTFKEEEPEARRRDEALATKLLQRLDPRVHPQYVRLEGDIEETVMDYAVDQGAALVLIGTTTQKLRFLPSLFYQTMQFMADSRVPLLVIPNDYGSRPRVPPRILITDDMSENTGSVRMALQLTKLLGFCHLLHINVRDYADVPMGLGSLSHIGIIADGYFPYNDYDPTVQMTQEHAKIERDLKRRFESVCTALGVDNGNYSYEAQFLIGDVSEEITRTAALFKADLVVFGSHDRGGLQIFHHKAMPDRIKLRQHRPILIAPIQKAG